MRRNWKKIALYLFLALAILFGGYKVWSVYHARKAIYEAPLGAFFGPADAEQTVVEFLDYRCSACRALEPVMAEVRKNHPDVRFVVRHLPVFMEPSVFEARLALAAGIQGKFREMHDILIARDAPVEQYEVGILAERLGLDAVRLEDEMLSTAVTFSLLETLRIAEIMNIKATPTFYINGRIFNLTHGMPDAAAFDRVLAGESADIAPAAAPAAALPSAPEQNKTEEMPEEKMRTEQ